MVDRPFGDQIDNASRTGDTEHQRVGAFQRFDAFLVFVGNRNDAGDRQASIESVI